MGIENVSNVSQTFSLQDIANITQPKPSGWSKFTSILGGIAGMAGNFFPGAGAVGGLLSSLGGGGTSGASGATGMVQGDNQQWQLLQAQYQMQQETQQFNLLTNISKDRHDAAMAAIRNIHS